MNSNVLSPETVRKKKMLILFCGVVIFFLTSMAKVLIPGTIYADLQKLGLDSSHIAWLGSAFLYAYALSQLLIGCFSDRYGGVRILLIGGSMFVFGTILFPLCSYYPLMIVLRVITGFGAGTIFLGVAKLLADLFPGKFGFALGCVLFFSYLGPTTGTMPMVKLVELISWKPAMILPGAVALLPMLLIIALAKGTIKPVTRGQTLHPLIAMVKNPFMWFACFACATVYGAYYALVGQIGKKSFMDLFGMEPGRAALFIMIMTLIVAVNNMLVELLLKLFGGRRKAVILFGVLLSLAGTVVGLCGLVAKLGVVCFVIAAFLLAIPAGFFPMFSTVAKELNKPKFTAMSVAFVNFMAFVFISLYQNVVGWILKAHPADPVTHAYPLIAYEEIFLFFVIGGAISLAACFFFPETRDKSPWQR